MAERSFVMLSRTAPAANPASDPIVTESLIRLAGLNVIEASAGVPKLQGLWKAGSDYYAGGTWQPLIGGINFSPASTTFPTLTAGGGPDGTDALVCPVGGNPGPLVAPSGALNWNTAHDFSWLAVIKPGATTGASKMIVGGANYDNIPQFALRNDLGLSLDFNLTQSGGGLTVFGPSISDARFWVVCFTWDASEGLARIRVGEAAAAGSATISGGEHTTIVVPRVALFAGPEQPPEATPGSPRYRIPATNMRTAAVAKFNVDLFNDAAAFDLAWAWLEETYPSACAPA